jgi:cobalamin biosynthesis Mg chelatase CobN
MTTKTAKHLNALLYRVNDPVKITHENGYQAEIKGQNTAAVNEISSAAISAAQRALPVAQREEIVEAARTRRAAVLRAEIKHLCAYEHENGSTVYAGAIMLALPEIQAMIDRVNAADRAAYENYRIACEQGVAVPPAE